MHVCICPDLSLTKLFCVSHNDEILAAQWETIWNKDEIGRF